MDITYTFPATRGIQAGKEYYTATIAYKYLVRLFPLDVDTTPADLRAQRKLNEGRAKGIAEYIMDNPQSYIIPALTASCDQSMTFTTLSDEHGVGILSIPITARLLINDGQHRWKGIDHALLENPALANDCVSVMICYDQGLNHAKQIFSDINSHACKPSGSLNALYDLRNPFSRWIIDILDKRPDIKARIDMEAASPAKTSSKLWSLIAFHNFINLLTGVNAKNIKSLASLDKKTVEVLDFLAALDHIPLWKAMVAGNISAPETREQYVVSHAVFLHALGLLGAHTSDMGDLAGLSQIDPTKGSAMWSNRCVTTQGKMRKTTDGIKSTTAVMMKLCGIELPADINAIDALC